MDGSFGHPGQSVLLHEGKYTLHNLRTRNKKTKALCQTTTRKPFIDSIDDQPLTQCTVVPWDRVSDEMTADNYGAPYALMCQSVAGYVPVYGVAGEVEDLLQDACWQVATGCKATTGGRTVLIILIVAGH